MAEFNTPTLTLDEVTRVGFLARLELSEGEKQRLTGELNGILGQFARLQELNTEGVAPTSHSLPLQNVFREDKIRPSLPREAATAKRPRNPRRQLYRASNYGRLGLSCCRGCRNPRQGNVLWTKT